MVDPLRSSAARQVVWPLDRKERVNSVIVRVKVLLFLLASSGCGTIFHGTSQEVGLDVSPPHATVAVYRFDGQQIAGPVEALEGSIKVHRPIRHEPYIFIAEADAHCPRYWVTRSRETPGVVADMLWTILMIIPLAIDSSTGGCCEILPQVIEGDLEGESLCRD